MGVHAESPDTRPTRNLCMGGATLVLGGIVWVAYSLYENPDGTHVGLFLTLALLLAVEFYLAWVIWVLSSVAYYVEDGTLSIAQGWQCLHVPRAQFLHMHRWRQRWIWNGVAQMELGVEEVALCPPVWVSQRGTVWVVVYEGDDGERKAVAIQPTPKLTGHLKEWMLRPSVDA